MSVLSFPSCPVPKCSCVRDGARSAMGACVVFLVEEVPQVLACPGVPVQVVETLSRVDAAFGCLDGLLRAGARIRRCGKWCQRLPFRFAKRSPSCMTWCRRRCGNAVMWW